MPSSDELVYLGAVELGARIGRKEISPVEATRAALARIEAMQPKLRAYASTMAERALADARAAKAEISAGRRRGPLHGVPVAVKDLCHTAGHPSAAGMKIHREFVPARDATVVARLRLAGAVVLGKLQMTEGAFSDHHPEVAPPLNPWNADYWCGSSSSGSGVATAAGLCHASLGSDTGGSIRFPSAACGVTGLKPTWGRVSRHGVFALAESLDHIGPMARSAEDCAAVLGAIAGADPHDPTALRSAVPDYLAGIDGGIAGLRVGVDRALLEAVCEPEPLAVIEAALDVLAGLGATICEVRLPDLRAQAQAWLPYCAVETAVAHEDTYPARKDEYGPGLAGLIETGRALSATALAKGLIERAKFSARLAALFETVDVLAVPVTPQGPMTVARRAELRRAPDPARSTMTFTAPFDMSGSPTITLPGGFDAAGLPVGFQLVGRHLEEGLLLRAGHRFQQATDWHRRRPPV